MPLCVLKEYGSGENAYSNSTKRSALVAVRLSALVGPTNMVEKPALVLLGARGNEQQPRGALSLLFGDVNAWIVCIVVGTFRCRCCWRWLASSASFSGSSITNEWLYSGTKHTSFIVPLDKSFKDLEDVVMVSFFWLANESEVKISKPGPIVPSSGAGDPTSILVTLARIGAYPIG